MYLRLISFIPLSLVFASSSLYAAGNSQTNIQSGIAQRIRALQTAFDKNNPPVGEISRPIARQKAVVLPKPITTPTPPAPKPVVKKWPVVTPQPIVAIKPIAPPQPVVKKWPVVTPQPTVAINPIATLQPVVKKWPIVNPQPIVAINPIATLQPVVKKWPVVTPQPIVAINPIATLQPVVKKWPVVTPQPTVAIKPIATPQPVVKKWPVVTPQPIVAIKPIVTPQPASTSPIIVENSTKASASRSAVNPVRPTLTFRQESISEETGMQRLYSQGAAGQGQKIAVIEYSGTWDKMHCFTLGAGVLPSEIRYSYARRFLRPLPLPGGVNPDKHFKECVDTSYHGSNMASTILDFSPQAQVLPVSTYLRKHHFYSNDDALMDLSKRTDINVINISSGWFTYRKEEYTERGILMHKYFFSEADVDGLKAAAKAGKIIVMAAGNQGEQIPSKSSLPGALPEECKIFLRIRALFNALDKETKKSIIFAGNISSPGGMIDPESNYPGDSEDLRKRFLFAPGNVDLSFEPGVLCGGTSFSAAYISATIANLLSKSENITPRMAVKALMKTADKRDPERVYGRGLIRADKASEFLDRFL